MTLIEGDSSWLFMEEKGIKNKTHARQEEIFALTLNKNINMKKSIRQVQRVDRIYQGFVAIRLRFMQ
jgi:hypothetical protein